jgi:hypothetical protein
MEFKALTHQAACYNPVLSSFWNITHNDFPPKPLLKGNYFKKLYVHGHICRSKIVKYLQKGLADDVRIFWSKENL